MGMLLCAPIMRAVEKPILSTGQEAAEKGADLCPGASAVFTDLENGQKVCFRGLQYDDFLFAHQKAAFFKQRWNECIESIDEKTLCLKEINQ